MRLEKHSNNFTPLREGILFGIDTESNTPTDLLVEIVNDATDEVVASQQLRGVVSGEVNIAPYISLISEYSPKKATYSQLYEAPVAAYHIRVGEVDSESVLVSVNSQPLSSLPSLVSSMPHTRSISCGDTDELLLLGEEGTIYDVTIVADTGDSTTLDYRSLTGAAILRISTEDFGIDLHTIDVEVACDGVHLCSLHYNVQPRYDGSVRVAWLSRKGSMEYYTFPVTSKVRVSSQRSCIDTLEKRRVTSSSSECEMTLISRYEPRETIQALSEILCSPKVWLETADEWTEVVVTSTDVEYNIFGEPDSLQVNVCKWSSEEGEL